MRRYHYKRGWGWTLDGISKEKHHGPNPWTPEDNPDWRLPLPYAADAAERLLARRADRSESCVFLEYGLIYP